MMSRILFTACVIAIWAGVAATQETETGDEAAVLAAVQKFFDTMASRDAAEARTVLDPDGSFVSVRWREGKQIVRRSAFRDYLDGLEQGDGLLLERMWDPEVRIHGPIAIVWTAYDFHQDGEFSHCGVDAFQLTKLERGWVIAGGTYTVEATGCAKSPLGVPRAN